MTDIKKIVIFCYLFVIVFFIVAGRPVALTYANASNKLGPLAQDLSENGNHSDYKIQHSASQHTSQNKTGDIELAGIVTKVIDGVLWTSTELGLG